MLVSYEGTKDLYSKDILQDTKVRFLSSSTIKGTGKICGVATTGAAVIGKSYIIELDESISGYEYSHICLFENQFEKL